MGSATLHEAAGRVGALPHAIKPVADTWTLAGPAFPVFTPPGNNVFIHDALYAAPRGSVLVVATGLHGHDPEWGYWGEILSHAAMVAGLAGIVLDGGARDATRLREQGFPVFSRGLSILGTGKDRAGGILGEPVTIGTVKVSAGDLVVGDIDGVVVIAASQAAAVLDDGVRREDKEATIMRRLTAGERSVDIYGF
ncbi:4-hydroxy-4-methyl-2-oxoglutarate aldolase [Amycolatopsis sp. RM579]|uniref:Putative 4-hydroxy-4-methyl-2-oxoglutarate aldolase n=1 Tax=Amycolatopsis pithecellobii TaxID=664692 RepID=A0A6N7Z7A2_9PSEU|nr:4-hydroxy-4-methyl-2-oxoglutarate aldolase [Amycolatopsis pithecellobii]